MGVSSPESLRVYISHAGFETVDHVIEIRHEFGIIDGGLRAVEGFIAIQIWVLVPVVNACSQNISEFCIITADGDRGHLDSIF